MQPEKLYGINTTLSLLESNAGNRKIYEILVNSNKAGSSRITDIITRAGNKGIHVSFIEPVAFRNIFLAGQPVNKLQQEDAASTQGVIAMVSGYNYPDLEADLNNISRNKVAAETGKNIIFAILDGITDVGNFGAILRNCSAFGVGSVIISKNRSARPSSRASRISSGALEEIKVYSVINLASAIKTLKDSGFWIYGTTLSEGRKIRPADEVDFSFPAAVVFGNEQKGIGRLVRESCDVLVKIDLYGRMASLNVSVSTGIMFHIIREYEKSYGQKTRTGSGIT